MLSLLDKAKYKVFDVNLRSPHYSKELVGELLSKADIVKLNAAELILIAEWYSPGCQSEEKAVQFLMERFDIGELLITRGGEVPPITLRISDTTAPRIKWMWLILLAAAILSCLLF